MRVFRKIKKCGDIVQVYQYEKGFQTGFSKTFGLYQITNDEGKREYFKADEGGELIQVLIGRQSQGTKTKKEEQDIRVRSMNKEKNKIRDIVNCNCYAWTDQFGETVRPKFLTLTFKENIQDLDIANNMFDKFMKRLNRYVKSKIDKNFIGVQYTTTIEFQDKYERGAIHYHILLYNLPVIAWANINAIWKYGGSWIEGFKDNNDKLVEFKYDMKTKCFKADGKSVKNIGAYITKTMSYMVKNVHDERLKGRKCSFCSTKLKKPIDLNDTNENKKEIELIEKSISANNLTFVNAYENEYIGKVSFSEYNIKFNNDARGKKYKNGIKQIISDDWIKQA